jgi:hypothetical protein
VSLTRIRRKMKRTRADFAAVYGVSEATGPPPPDNLAFLVNKMLQFRLGDDKEKALLDSLPRPSNVPMLATRRVNGDVWGVMETKSDDIKLSRIEDRVSRVLVACANITAGLQELKGALKGEMRNRITSLS